MEGVIERRHSRAREGTVLKDGMNKTRIVEVSQLYRHPQYQKVMRKRVKYAAHDEKNESHVGDRVRMVETRPLSRTKRWRIVELIGKPRR